MEVGRRAGVVWLYALSHDCGTSRTRGSRAHTTVSLCLTRPVSHCRYLSTSTSLPPFFPFDPSIETNSPHCYLSLDIGSRSRPVLFFFLRAGQRSCCALSFSFSITIPPRGRRPDETLRRSRIIGRLTQDEHRICCAIRIDIAL